MENILTLEQMQTMSTEDIINAYRNGYRLSENTEILPLKDAQVVTLQHYTWSDLGIITAAILVSVGLTGALGYYLIKREENKIIGELKTTITDTITKGAGVIQSLVPIAERLIAPRPT